jgi:PAS domain S-box-containing protein
VDIRKKTLIIICATLLGLIVVLWALSQVVVLEGFTEVEQQSVRKDTNRVLVAFGDDLNTLDAVAHDWSSQQGIGDQLRQENSTSVWIKLHEDTFERLQFNYIIFYDPTGEFAAGRGYDLGRRTAIQVPEDIQDLFSRDTYIRELARSPSGTVGLLKTQEGPLMVAMRPVVPGPAEGSPDGVLLMGRSIDEREVERLASMTQLPVTVRSIDDPALPDDFRAAFTRIPRTGHGFLQRHDKEIFTIDAPIYIEAKGDNELFSFVSANDFYGNPALILRVTFDRGILAQGRSTTLYFMWLIYAAGLAFGLITLFLLEKTVISRLSFLSNKVNAIGGSQNFAERVHIPGNDEIAKLATDVNSMLGALEKSQEAVIGQLDQSEERYRLLVESSPDGIVVLKDDEIIYANTAAAGLFGSASRNELTGKAITPLVVPTSLIRIQEGERRSRNRKGTVFPLIEGEIVRFDGRHVSVEMIGVATIYSDSPVLQMVIRDITERKREEDALKQANKKLNILNVNTLNDIRNHLFTLMGYVSLAKDVASTEVERDFINKEENVTRAILTQLAFIEHYQNMGVQPPRWQNVLEVYLYALSHVSLGGIRRHESVEGIEIYADPLLERVFFNLIDNVIRHGSHATEIALSGRETPEGLTILFEDNGGGISPADKEKIFERRYGKQTGIGLFLVREILGITGISVRETGESGKGARFEIHVPQGYYRFVSGESATGPA